MAKWPSRLAAQRSPAEHAVEEVEAALAGEVRR